MPFKAYSASMPTYTIQSPAQLSTHLRSLRKARGLTQAQLGERVGLDQTRIAKIERDPSLVSLAQILQICAALGANIELRSSTANPGPQSKKPAEW
jgi:HTH-type transcriptional regulator / antitoxin HipB